MLASSGPKLSVSEGGGNLMALIPIEKLPKLHCTPLATVSIDSPKVIVEVDDELEKRFRLYFEPYQAVKITTADCFLVEEGTIIIPQTIVHVDGSAWLNELRKNLSIIDETAEFLDDAKHYLVPLQDDFLEVVAWSVSVEYL